MKIRLLTAALLLPLAGCSDAADLVSPADESLGGDAALGLEAFRAECASCHAATDGFDLSFFSFPDSTIIRRALAHVDLDTARDIVAHIDRIGAETAERDAPVFQPLGRVLVSDRQFAFELFGDDAWPEELTTPELLGIDPREVAIAMELPHWSVEGRNLDWMPDRPIDTAVLTFLDGDAALDAYRAVPSDQNLINAVQRLRVGALSPENPEAPCVHQEPERVRYEACFQNQRWIAALAGQHMLRRGDDELHPFAHDAFWDVGFTVRNALVRGEIPFENGVENWATWSWMGWMFEPQNHGSIYAAQGVSRFGLPRHATFLALRSQVARHPGSIAPYRDARTAVFVAPDHWVGSATLFALSHLVERLKSGDEPTRFPPDEDITDVRETVGQVAELGQRRAPDRAAEIRARADRVLELLPAG